MNDPEGRFISLRCEISIGGTNVIPETHVTLRRGMNLLAGANGSGKSTLLSALCGPKELLQQSGIVVSADIQAFRERFQSIRLSHQSVSKQVIGTTLMDDARITEALRGAAKGSIDREVSSRWHGYAELRNRAIGSVSRGQLQSFVNTMSCCEPPQIIGLDEPDSFLDDDGLAALARRLENLIKRDPMAIVIVVSHRVKCWQAALTSEANLIRLGSADAATAGRRQATARVDANDGSDLAVVSRGRWLRFDGRWVRFRDPVILRKGELIEISGGNGAGKTTIMRYLHKRMKRRATCAFLPDWSADIGEYRLLSELDLIRPANGILVELDADRARPMQELSWGQRRLAHIAEIISGQAEIVFLDEPFAGLSPTSAERVAAFIDENVRHGVCVIMSNNRKELNHLSTVSRSLSAREMVA